MMELQRTNSRKDTQATNPGCPKKRRAPRTYGLVERTRVAHERQRRQKYGFHWAIAHGLPPCLRATSRLALFLPRRKPSFSRRALCSGALPAGTGTRYTSVLYMLCAHVYISVSRAHSVLLYFYNRSVYLRKHAAAELQSCREANLGATVIAEQSH